MKELSMIIATILVAPLAVLLSFAAVAGGLASLPGPLGWRIVSAFEALVMVGFAVRYAVWAYRITGKL
jgi:hypothetical protein